jgi:hypothetical protein
MTNRRDRRGQGKNDLNGLKVAWSGYCEKNLTGPFIVNKIPYGTEKCRFLTFSKKGKGVDMKSIKFLAALFLFLFLDPAFAHAAKYMKGDDGYYYMDEEAQAAYQSYVDSLPIYRSPIPPGDLPREKLDLLPYVGYPRDQGNTGLCWAFSMVGMLEVQHGINCAICSGELEGDCPGYTNTCPEGEFFPLHLSLETYLECSTTINFQDPLAFISSELDPLGYFLFDHGLPYEQLYPYKFAADTGYRPELDRFPFICPMMDRYYSPGCPDYVEGERDGICALKDISDATGIPLDFYKFQGELQAVEIDPTYTIIKQALADNHVVRASIDWCVRPEGPLTVCEYPAGCPTAVFTGHGILIIGYYESESSLYWIFRNSHGEPGPLIMEESEAEECHLTGDMVIVGRTEGYQDITSCPWNWLYDDPDGDFIFNINDRCRFTENHSNVLDRDCDFWPEDLDAETRGCDNCFSDNPDRSKNPYQSDIDGDGIGDACDTVSMVPNLDLVAAGSIVADLSDSHIFSMDPPDHIREGRPLTSARTFPARTAT